MRIYSLKEIAVVSLCLALGLWMMDAGHSMGQTKAPGFTSQGVQADMPSVYQVLPGEGTPPGDQVPGEMTPPGYPAATATLAPTATAAP